MKRESISFHNVRMDDTFWRPRIAGHAKTLYDNLDKCEKTGRLVNFARGAGKEPGGFEGRFCFNDSDVYKVLEGVAYYLRTREDADMERRADAVINLIAAAQWEDGYLNNYYKLKEPGMRYTEMSMHEMYCAGHLFEAAVAYHQATGKDVLLNVAKRFADHIDTEFRVANRHWVPGHEEIELALIRLYGETGEERYLLLARYLLDQRGHDYGTGKVYKDEKWGKRYCQDDRPCEDMREVSGHAVRAMYLYTAMAAYEAVTGETVYDAALDSLWESVTRRNMYVTGGIGSTRTNEGFTEDFDLPNDTAYCETCAAVGLVLWASRMGVLRGDARYYDILERALYNGALSGVSLSGDKYFYENPLSTDGSHHRQEWFDCSCCPTQVARFIPSVGNYLYATEGNDTVIVNLFAQSEADIPLGGDTVKLTQTTNYPWNGAVSFRLRGSGDLWLKVRVPGWCPSARVRVDGVELRPKIENGYAIIERANAADVIEFIFDMPVSRITADARVKADAGRIALMRGPLAYCVEQCDNAHYDDLSLSPLDRLTYEWSPDLLGGVMLICAARENLPGLLAVPYYAWDNRDPGRMDVWLPVREADAGLYSR